METEIGADGPKNHLIEWLKLLSRKERQMLLNDALGGFSLNDSFRARLSECGIDVPPDAHVWMDYPLDWIYVAYELAGMSPGDFDPNSVFASPNFGRKDPVLINANQEDVDLLVAFTTEKGETRLVMIEAKGVTSWGNSQFQSKAHRLKIIFDEAATWHRDDVIPTYAILSPRPTKNLEIQEWFPSWMLTKDGLPQWIPLTPLGRSARIQRWDTSSRASLEAAESWRIVITEPKD